MEEKASWENKHKREPNKFSLKEVKFYNLCTEITFLKLVYRSQAELSVFYVDFLRCMYTRIPVSILQADMNPFSLLNAAC